MKKFTSVMLAVGAIFVSTAVQAKNKVYLNNNEISGYCYADGTAVIGVRSFFEKSGYTVQWFADENRAIVFNADTKINLIAGVPYFYINSYPNSITDKVRFIDGQLIMSDEIIRKTLDAVIGFYNEDLYIYYSNAQSVKNWDYEVLELTNKEREKYGLSPLRWNYSLEKAARLHCEDMAARDYFDHYTPEGLSPFDRLKGLGITYRAAAENIAAGQPDPESVVRAWMNSEGHRANILNENLKEIGIAHSRGGTYGIYWAQEFASLK